LSTKNLDIPSDWWKTLFDEIYLITDARSVCNEEITSREVDLICALLPIRAHDHILDLCGGHGRHSLEFCARGFSCCTLVDYSACLLKTAQKKALSCNYSMGCIRSDARKAGLCSDYYHHVLILGNSLGYLTEKDADKEILTEAWRILRPKGWALVDITNGDHVKKRMTPMAWHEIAPEYVVCRERHLVENTLRAREVVLSKKKGLIRDRNYAIHLYSPASVKALMEEAGFGNIQVHTDFSPHCQPGDYGFMNCRMVVTGQKP